MKVIVRLSPEEVAKACARYVRRANGGSVAKEYRATIHWRGEYVDVEALDPIPTLTEKADPCPTPIPPTPKS